jgi:predicted ribosomally synthesized peptide with nif11-like leader
MSKENAKNFLAELAGSAAMQEQWDELKPASPEDAVSFAKKAGFGFTEEELKAALTETGTLELSDEELEKVSAGTVAVPSNLTGQVNAAVADAYQHAIQVMGVANNATQKAQELLAATASNPAYDAAIQSAQGAIAGAAAVLTTVGTSATAILTEFPSAK